MRKSIQALEEMARIGFINKENKPRQESGLEVFVYTNDGGSIPHFHIKIQGEQDACVRFDSAKYFSHGSKTSKISSKSAKQLDSMLRSVRRGDETYWEFAIDMWNTNNSKMEIPYDLIQPDYTKLNQ